MHWAHSGKLMVMVILGGMQSLVGPVIGTIAFLMLEEWLSSWTQHWMIIMGPLLLALVLFARRGLYGFFADIERIAREIWLLRKQGSFRAQLRRLFGQG